MQLLLLLLFMLAAVSQARRLPEFTDNLLGTMVVSGKKFPFLTPKHARDRAYVYPTDQQLGEIKSAIAKVSRSRRALSAEMDDDVFPSDPSAAFAWFESQQKFLAKFLKFEFSYEVLNSTPNDPGNLNFDKTDSDAYFKTMVIGKEEIKPFLEEQFFPRLRRTQETEKPWLPAEKLVQELTDCRYFKYGSASDENLKYDKETGGTMIYYKVACVRVKDDFYIAMATYDNVFKLKDITTRQILKSTVGISAFGFGVSRTKEKIHTTVEKAHLSLNDLKMLLDYIMREFAARIRTEYGAYFTQADIPLHQ